MKKTLAYILLGIGSIGLTILITIYWLQFNNKISDQQAHKSEETSAQTAAPELWVKPEVFHSTPKQVPLDGKLYSQKAGLSITGTQQRLAGLSETERQKITNNIGLQISRAPEPIGIVRPLQDVLPSEISSADLEWLDVSEGKIAHWAVQSPGAVALRLQLTVTQINEGGEIRFFSLNDPTKTYKAFRKQQLMPNGSAKAFWSPTVDGDVIGIELFIPNTAGEPDIRIETPKLSHIYKSMFGTTMDSSATVNTRTSDSCHVDIACAPQARQEIAKSVAKYIYVKGDFAYYCSGTLLSDNDSSTQIPYFITANHCVDNPTSAESMELYWLFKNNQCTGGTPVNPKATSGATLLMNSEDSDLSFVLLDDAPPNGTTMSGWTSTALTPEDSVYGIHHPQGDVKKYSAGTFKHFESITMLGNVFYVGPDPEGSFMQVVWSEGITAGGSSGSGLWIENNGNQYLVGTLLGGTSYCSSPFAPDDYGRFDRGYPLISQWLDPNSGDTTLDLNFTVSGESPAALKDGVLLARYLKGLRGSALVDGIAESENITELEAKLATSANQLDIDGDGNVTVDQDSMLLIRYMMDMRGESLTEGVVSTGASRTHPIEIELFLDDLFADQ